MTEDQYLKQKAEIYRLQAKEIHLATTYGACSHVLLSIAQKWEDKLEELNYRWDIEAMVEEDDGVMLVSPETNLDFLGWTCDSVKNFEQGFDKFYADVVEFKRPRYLFEVEPDGRLAITDYGDTQDA